MDQAKVVNIIFWLSFSLFIGYFVVTFIKIWVKATATYLNGFQHKPFFHYKKIQLVITLILFLLVIFTWGIKIYVEG
jgi:hypothetical protein